MQSLAAFDSGRVFARAMAVPRGLFCLRYIDADDPSAPPLVSVHPAPGFDAHIKLFGGPDQAERLMRRPGDVLVIASSDNATLVVTIFVGSAAAGDNVKLKLERLDRAPEEADETETETTAAEPPVPNLLPVALSGHLGTVGDVSLTPGAWLGSRRGRRAIEGLSLGWEARPLDVDILYGCVVEELGRMPESLTGGFVGMRGRGQPITGFSARLVGDRAELYQLEVEAAFADNTNVGPLVAPVDISAPGESVAIVGLRVLVKAREQENKGSGHRVASDPIGRKPAERRGANTRKPKLQTAAE